MESNFYNIEPTFQLLIRSENVPNIWDLIDQVTCNDDLLSLVFESEFLKYLRHKPEVRQYLLNGLWSICRKMQRFDMNHTARQFWELNDRVTSVRSFLEASFPFIFGRENPLGVSFLWFTDGMNLRSVHTYDSPPLLPIEGNFAYLESLSKNGKEGIIIRLQNFVRRVALQLLRCVLSCQRMSRRTIEAVYDGSYELSELSEPTEQESYSAEETGPPLKRSRLENNTPESAVLDEDNEPQEEEEPVQEQDDEQEEPETAQGYRQPENNYFEEERQEDQSGSRFEPRSQSTPRRRRNEDRECPEQEPENPRQENNYHEENRQEDRRSAFRFIPGNHSTPRRPETNQEQRQAPALPIPPFVDPNSGPSSYESQWRQLWEYNKYLQNLAHTLYTRNQYLENRLASIRTLTNPE